MGFLDWMKGNNPDIKERAGERKVSLSHAERWALRRMTQQFDDGLVGHKHGGAWEKTFNEMAERLTLRFRDPFGDRPMRISPKEAEALNEFQKMYAREAGDIYPGNGQMQCDASSIRDALDRSGAPETPVVRKKKASRQRSGNDIEF
jgi:hypothetical protein